MEQEPIHGSAFVYQGRGCLLLGESGSGKSRLLAEAILHRAHPIADDRVRLCTISGNLVARSVPNLCGVIELRGLGIIRRADMVESHPIHLVVELSEAYADKRALEPYSRDVMGIKVPCLQLPPPPTLSVATLLLYLQAMQEGRILPADWRPEQH